jgi:hypothetical protein
MSYDLAVFETSAAPRDRAAFLEWFQRQTEWDEPHSFDDPSVSSPALRAWFMDMIKDYPAMNGPYSSAELPEDEAAVTDYSVGKALIYATFAWSKAEPAYEAMVRLAEKHGVGFFDVSSDTSAVWVPGEDGQLVQLHSD